MTPVALSLLLAMVVTAAPARGAEISMRVARDGDALQVEASAEFDGTPMGTWRVLTDYGRLAEFIPDIRSSRVLSREGNVAVVAQQGAAGFLFLSFPIDVRLRVTEYPYERIVSRAVAGNFRELRGVYRLEAGQGRMRLHYTGRLVPDFYVPPLIGTLVLRHSIEATFRGLVDEIERRNGPVSRDSQSAIREP